MLTSGQVMRDLRLSTFTVEDTPSEEEKRDWQRLIASYLVGQDTLAAVKPRHYQRVAAFDLGLALGNALKKCCGRGLIHFQANQEQPPDVTGLVLTLSMGQRSVRMSFTWYAIYQEHLRIVAPVGSHPQNVERCPC